jgi:glycosyltransferase involved in cell wall biosynthesis
MPSYFRQADVLFLSLRDDYIFRLTAPARLQAYMAAGKPVIAMADGETADLVEEAACGYACAAGDYRAFADCVLRMKSLPEDERVRMGMDGRDFFFKKFRKDRCIDHLCAILPEI